MLLSRFRAGKTFTQRERERELGLLQPKTTHTCFLPIHTTTGLCKHIFSMHTDTPSVSVGFTTISVLLQTSEQQLHSPLFSHYLVSAEKPRAIYLPQCLSVCAYIQTSAAYFSHHLLQCFSGKASNHLQLYNTLPSFKKTSCRKEAQRWKVASIPLPICQQESAAMALYL